MASPFASLKTFAGSRRGRIAIGGTAVGGVVVAGLARRRGAGGDPASPGEGAGSAPPFAVAPATGTSGTNLDAFPNLNSGGIDVALFEQLLANNGRTAAAADTAAMEQQIKDLFARYSVPITYGKADETAEQRVARLAREQIAGTRTWDELQKAIQALARDQAAKAGK